MATPNLPSIDRLRDVDIADCTYQDSVCEIEGVVTKSSEGGWPHSDGYEVKFFSLGAWRLPGETIAEKELGVLMPVDPRTSSRINEYPVNSIHRIRVLLSTDNTRAIFAGTSEQVAVSEGLLEKAKELAKPVVVTSTYFGELTLDRSIDHYVGHHIWDGKLIQISLYGKPDPELSLKTAEALWVDQKVWKDRVHEYALLKLLAVKNEAWLEDNETPVSPQLFQSNLELESISIGINGKIEFWLRCGDLFWGHAILISGSLTEGLDQADIAG